MSLLSGLIGPAINVATKAAGTYQGAQAQRLDDGTATAMKQAQIVREQQQDAIRQAVAQRQAESAGITDKLNQIKLQQGEYELAHPKPVEGSKEWESAQIRKTQIENQYGYHAPHDSFQFMQGTDADGNPVFVKGNKQSGVLAATDVGGKMGASGAGGGLDDARLQTARNQAKAAEDIMHTFEEDLKGKRTNISLIGSGLAKVALSNDPVKSAIAEATLNTTNPRLAQYVRAAKQFATAERLITPRGGSNAMMAAEALLSQAGPYPTEDQIEQARAYRTAFGHGVGGKANTAGGSLTPEQKARAAAEPDYAEFLKAQGKL